MLSDKKLIFECQNDFKRCFIDQNISDTWNNTGSQNINYFNKNYIEDIPVNANFKALVHIDNYPSTSYLNKNNIGLLKKLQSSEKLKFYKKIDCGGEDYSASYVIHYRNFLQIKKKIKKGSKILEIGGGLGVLTSMINKVSKTKNFMCDIPQTLIFQKYYIKKNFPNAKTQFIANRNDKVDLSNDFIFINSSQLNYLKLPIDMMVNIDSFSEMDQKTVNNYLNFCSNNLKNKGFLYLSNTMGHYNKGYLYPYEIPISKSFDVIDCSINYPSFRNNYSKYLNLLLQKRELKKGYHHKKIFKKIYLEADSYIFKEKSQKIKKKLIKKNDYSIEKGKIKKEISLECQYSVLFKSLIKEKNYSKSILKNINYSIFKKDTPLLANLIFANKLINIKIDDNIEHLSEKNFEDLFLKFNLAIDKQKKKLLFSKLIKKKKENFFIFLKIYYCSSIIDNKKFLEKYKKKIISFSNKKIYKLYFLKLLILLKKFKDFKKYFQIFKKNHNIKKEDLISDIISINTDNKLYTKQICSYLKKSTKLNTQKINPDIELLLLNFKTGIINEKKFMYQIKVKYWNNYYSLGFILKNTLNFLSKKNIIRLSKRSLILRNNLINKLFISDIFFYNFMFQDAYKILNEITNLEKINIFYELKRNICIKKNKLFVKNLINLGFFKIFNSGYLSFIPFLNGGNNQVNLSYIKGKND